MAEKSDTEALILLCTCPGTEPAERLARALVEERLAACVNICGGVTSVYRWEGEVTRDSEVLLLIKTTRARFEDVRKSIVELHSYETPEIIAVPVVAGSDKYLAWLRAQV